MTISSKRGHIFETNNVVGSAKVLKRVGFSPFTFSRAKNGLWESSTTECGL